MDVQTLLSILLTPLPFSTTGKMIVVMVTTVVTVVTVVMMQEYFLLRSNSCQNLYLDP